MTNSTFLTDLTDELIKELITLGAKRSEKTMPWFHALGAGQDIIVLVYKNIPFKIIYGYYVADEITIWTTNGWIVILRFDENKSMLYITAPYSKPNIADPDFISKFAKNTLEHVASRRI